MFGPRAKSCSRRNCSQERDPGGARQLPPVTKVNIDMIRCARDRFADEPEVKDDRWWN